MASRLLHRTRLLRLLQRPDPVRLVLVHGAAGSGKSCLLADFVQESVAAVAWYSLDEGDRDPQVFLEYLVQALSETYPGSVARTQALRQGAGPQELTTQLVNDVLAYGERVTLVLDDSHLVDASPEVRSILETLTRQGPDNLTLILATRELPSLPLAWLRSKGMLLEIRQDDLRFREDEIADLFAQWEQALEADVIPLLFEKTEGWVTALQLVAQAVRGRTPAEVRRYIAALEGREEYIYHYLATEVYERQPDEVRAFLTSTSVPDSFDHALAQELAGGNAYERIHHLDNARLFLVHLDREGEWFRYHHLFRDFLRRRLSIERSAEEVRDLQLRAARWFEEHGDVRSSIPLYLAADPALGADVLEREGSLLLTQGLLGSVVAWLAALPQSLRGGRPGLQALEAQVLDLQGDWPAAVPLYEAVLRHYRERGEEVEAFEVLEKLALCYMKYSEFGPLIAICEEALRECPPGADAMRGVLSSWLGAALVQTARDWDRGYALAEEGHELAYRSGEARAISWGSLTYGFAYHFPKGNFDQALRVLNDGIAFFRQLGWAVPMYQLSMNKAVVLILQGELGTAQELVEDSLHLAERAGHTFVVRGLQNLRAFLLVERRDLAAAREQLAREAEHHVPAQMRPWHYRNQMLLHCYEGKLEQARVAEREMLRALELNGYGMYAPECLVSQAVLLLALGELDQADSALERCLEISAAGHCKFWRMKGRVVQAHVALLRGRRELLEVALAEALVSTEVNGYDAFWAADPFGLAKPLVLAASALSIVPETSARLRAALADQAVPAARPLLESPWPEVRALAEDLVARSQPATAPGTLQIRALGRLAILRDGELLDLDRLLRPQAVRLLKHLLSQPEGFASGDAVLEAFWPTAPLARARHSLAVHLSSLRRVLGPGNPVVRTAEGLRVEFGSHAGYDVADFERLAGEGRDLLRRGDPETGMARLLRAEELYRGDFLSEDLYEDAVTARRLELRGRFEGLLELLADRDREEGRHAEAMERYRRILEGERLDETVFAKLLDCHAAAGDRTAAMREFERFRQRMLDETGLEPAASTRALLDRLCAGRPLLPGVRPV